MPGQSHSIPQNCTNDNELSGKLPRIINLWGEKVFVNWKLAPYTAPSAINLVTKRMVAKNSNRPRKIQNNSNPSHSQEVIQLPSPTTNNRNPNTLMKSRRTPAEWKQKLPNIPTRQPHLWQKSKCLMLPPTATRIVERLNRMHTPPPRPRSDSLSSSEEADEEKVKNLPLHSFPSQMEEAEVITVTTPASPSEYKSTAFTEILKDQVYKLINNSWLTLQHSMSKG